MMYFTCTFCGHLEFDRAPAKCPVCTTTTFDQNNNVFKESEEKSTGKELSLKHIPDIVINKECKMITEVPCADVLVRVGKSLHPTEENHYIEWIDCYVDNRHVERAWFTAGVQPAACFHLNRQGKNVTVVENCNVHGYWIAESSLA